MFTIVDSAILALNVLMTGGSVVICLAALYWMVRYVDSRFHRPDVIKNVLPSAPLVKFEGVRKHEDKTTEDIPDVARTFKIETSFDGKRIGKV